MQFFTSIEPTLRLSGIYTFITVDGSNEPSTAKFLSVPSVYIDPLVVPLIVNLSLELTRISPGSLVSLFSKITLVSFAMELTLITPWPEFTVLKLLILQFSIISVPLLASINRLSDASFSVYTKCRFLRVSVRLPLLLRVMARLFLSKHDIVTPSTACMVRLFLSGVIPVFISTSLFTSIRSPAVAAVTAASIVAYSVLPIHTCAIEAVPPTRRAASSVKIFFMGC